MQSVTDNTLFAAVQKKDSKAFRKLYERYQLLIYNFILKLTGKRLLAQDLLQDSFVRIWLTASQFNPSKGSVRNWIYTIAANLCKNEMARKRYQYQYQELLDDVDLNQTEHPEHQIEQKLNAELVAKILEKMDLELREVFVFKQIEQFKFSEIADMTGVNENTLKSRYQKALGLLRSEMERIDQ